MVAISEVKSANAALKNNHESLTAVFAGATAGIGLATVKAFAKHIPRPKAIIVGRSRAKFEPELQALRTINTNGEYTFIEADISLIKNIDAVCEQIKKQVSTIDLLYVSQGYISFNGRENNADGLDNSTSLRYYGRVRFTQDLLPIMSRNGRAISVLAGGQEGKIFEDDLDLERNYSIVNAAGQMVTMMTLSYDKFAQQNPEKSFIHAYPGLVSTNILANSAKGILGLFFQYIVQPILSFFALTPLEVGERMLYYGTSEQFSRGSWALDQNGTAQNVKALVEYRERGMADKVVEHNQKIFERATSA